MVQSGDAAERCGRTSISQIVMSARTPSWPPPLFSETVTYLGFGRIVVSEIEGPNIIDILAHMV